MVVGDAKSLFGQASPLSQSGLEDLGICAPYGSCLEGERDVCVCRLNDHKHTYSPPFHYSVQLTLFLSTILGPPLTSVTPSGIVRVSDW